jgi:hypothetical protein
MKRWLGVWTAVGSATAAVVVGSAWAAPGEVPRANAGDDGHRTTMHDCGHDDKIEAEVDRTGGRLVVVRAVDGAADPVEAAFQATTVSVPSARGAAAGVGSAELRLPRRAVAGELRVEATFDDGITRCSWTLRVPAPRGP